jgi:hypothetical protein
MEDEDIRLLTLFAELSRHEQMYCRTSRESIKKIPAESNYIAPMTFESVPLFLFLFRNDLPHRPHQSAL